MRIPASARNRLIYPIKLMAKAFAVSRSGYYAWLIRKPRHER
jgi:hypothetical protein